MADETPQPKTAAELKAEYETLAADVTKLARERPKKIAHIEARVKAAIKKDIADFEKNYEEKKAAKHAAYVAWEAAVTAGAEAAK